MLSLVVIYVLETFKIKNASLHHLNCFWVVMRDKTTHTLNHRQFRTSQSNKRVFGLREKTASPGLKLSRHRGEKRKFYAEMWQHTFLLQVRVSNDRTTVRMKIKNVKYVPKLWAFKAFEKNLQLSNSGGTIFFEELKHKFSLNRFYFVCEYCKLPCCHPFS